jgi:hypothetical protein
MIQQDMFEQYVEDRRKEFWTNFYKEKLEEVKSYRKKNEPDMDFSLKHFKAIPFYDVINNKTK